MATYFELTLEQRQTYNAVIKPYLIDLQDLYTQLKVATPEQQPGIIAQIEQKESDKPTVDEWLASL